MKEHLVMDEGFYEDLFKHFRSVAFKVAPIVASDKDLCREIFHEKVLFPRKVCDIGQAVARIRGQGLTFCSPKAYSNWLYTVFKNAVLEHLRAEGREKKRLVNVEEGDLDRFPDPHPDPTRENPPYLEQCAKGLLDEFSREERRLLSLRYIANKTMEEVGQLLNISTSTVSRWEKRVKGKLAEKLCVKNAEIDEKDQLYVLEAFLSLIGSEGKGNACRKS